MPPGDVQQRQVCPDDTSHDTQRHSAIELSSDPPLLFHLALTQTFSQGTQCPVSYMKKSKISWVATFNQEKMCMRTQGSNTTGMRQGLSTLLLDQVVS